MYSDLKKRKDGPKDIPKSKKVRLMTEGHKPAKKISKSMRMNAEAVEPMAELREESGGSQTLSVTPMKKAKHQKDKPTIIRKDSSATGL